MAEIAGLRFKALAELAAIVERAMVTQLVHSYRVRGKKAMSPGRVARHHGLGNAEG